MRDIPLSQERVWGSNPSGGEIFHTRTDRPWDPRSFLYDKYKVLPGSKVVGAWH